MNTKTMPAVLCGMIAVACCRLSGCGDGGDKKEAHAQAIIHETREDAQEAVRTAKIEAREAEMEYSAIRAEAIAKKWMVVAEARWKQVETAEEKYKMATEKLRVAEEALATAEMREQEL